MEGKSNSETLEEFSSVITAAVPAALLQYESHGKPRSSLCLLNTMPSWWLVNSSKRNKVLVCFLEAPSCFSSSLQRLQFLHAEHTQQERLGKEQSRKGALKSLVDEAGFGELCLRGSRREAVVSESTSV